MYITHIVMNIEASSFQLNVFTYEACEKNVLINFTSEIFVNAISLAKRYFICKNKDEGKLCTQTFTDAFIKYMYSISV